MQTLTLWQIDAAYLLLLDRLEENNGELSPELEKELDGVIADLTSKQDGYIKVIDTLDSLEYQTQQWRDRMDQKIKTIRNHRDRLKAALIRHFHLTGMTEHRGELGRIKLMKTVKVGEIDLDRLADDYKQTVTEIRVDKRRLLDDLRAGPIEGAQLEEVEYIRIFR